MSPSKLPPCQGSAHLFFARATVGAPLPKPPSPLEVYLGFQQHPLLLLTLEGRVGLGGQGVQGWDPRAVEATVAKKGGHVYLAPVQLRGR